MAVFGFGFKKGILSAFLTEKPPVKKNGAKGKAGAKARQYLTQHISVDCVIFGYSADELKVLLCESANNPTKSIFKNGLNAMALPGDEVQEQEDLDTSAKRISKQVTGVGDIFMEQLRVLAYPAQPLKKTDFGWLSVKSPQPGMRIIKVAYFAIMNLNDAGNQAQSANPGLKWYPVKKIPRLSLDNKEALQKALETLRFKLAHFPLLFELLPEKFTLGEAQLLYEVISGKKLDKRNFRRKLNSQNLLTELNEKQKDVAHKPARLYRFNFKGYEKLISDSSPFPVF